MCRILGRLFVEMYASFVILGRVSVATATGLLFTDYKKQRSGLLGGLFQDPGELHQENKSI